VWGKIGRRGAPLPRFDRRLVRGSRQAAEGDPLDGRALAQQLNAGGASVLDDNRIPAPAFSDDRHTLADLDALVVDPRAEPDLRPRPGSPDRLAEPGTTR